MPDDDFDQRAREAGRALRQDAPADGLARVERSRRNRRIAQVAGAVAVIALAVAGIVVIASNGDDESVVSTEPGISTTAPDTSATTAAPVEPTTMPATAPPSTPPSTAPSERAAVRQPATKAPMEDLLRRARSAGLGILLASQSPGDFDYKCRDNIKSWLVGQVKEETALRKLKPMFAAFSLSVGVANVRDVLAGIDAPPKFITRAREAKGFGEVADAVVRARRRTGALAGHPTAAAVGGPDNSKRSGASAAEKATRKI